MKKIILIVVVLILAIGGVTAGTVMMNQPEAVAARALSGIFEDLLAREEIAPLLNVLKGGSIEADLRDVSLEGESRNGVSGKIYFGGDDLYLDDLSYGNSGGEISVNAYLSNDLVYFESDGILGGAYGIRRGEAVEALQESIFAPYSGSEYALSQGDYDALLRTLEIYDSPDDYEDMLDDAQGILEDYGKEFWSLFCENADFKKDTRKISLQDETVSARVITVFVDSYGMANWLRDAYYFVREDGAILDLMIEYGELLADLTSDSTFYNENKITKLYYDMMDEVLSGLNTYIDAMESSREYVTVEIATAKMSASVYQITVGLKNERITLDIGKEGLSQSERITLWMLSASGRETRSLDFEILQNDDDAYVATLSSDIMPTYTLTVDRTKGEYLIEKEAEGELENYKVRGAIVRDGDTLTLSITSVERYLANLLQKRYELDVTLIFDERDKMPKKASGVEELFAVQEYTVENWLEKIEEILSRMEAA